MAKNYTFAEAVKIINAGTDLESIADIGRRYPVLLHKVTNVTSKAGEAFVDLMNYMPEYLTANKVNTAIKNGINESESDTNEDGEDIETEATTKDEDEATTKDSTDYESMSAKQLWDILGKAGKRKLAKSTKKADLVEACKAMDAGEDAETEDAETEDATEANPYEGKSAMELFKECKKRGIKAAPKKPAKFYAELLVKDDAKSTETESEDAGEDDWNDETEETEVKEEAKPKSGKKSKASAKKEKTETTSDDDDDWDI